MILVILFLLQQQPGLKQEYIRSKALLLPDISLVGDIVNLTEIHEKIKNSFSIREFELAVQGYIHTKIRIDTFISAHGNHDISAHGNHEENGHGDTGINVEEGYVSFLQIAGPVGGRLGRKYIEFGRFNPLHPEQRRYVDIPKVLQDTFGEENLIGDGGNISFLFAYPIAVVKLEGGIWRKFTGPFDDVFYTGRLVSSFPAGELSEIQLGLSSASGGVERKFTNILGGDISFTYTGPKQKIKFVFEAIGKLSESFDFRGFYTSVFYSTQRWETGPRFDFVRGKIQGVSPVFSFLITETTKLRFQYGFYRENRESKHNVFFQFIFAIGPHGHVLQF